MKKQIIKIANDSITMEFEVIPTSATTAKEIAAAFTGELPMNLWGTTPFRVVSVAETSVPVINENNTILRMKPWSIVLYKGSLQVILREYDTPNNPPGWLAAEKKQNFSLPKGMRGGAGQYLEPLGNWVDYCPGVLGTRVFPH